MSGEIEPIKSYNNLLHSMAIIKKIKTRRLRRAGHVARVEAQDGVKRPFLYDPDDKRNVGRLKPRCRDGIQQDAERAGIRSWWMVTSDRDRWRGLLHPPRVVAPLVMMMMMMWDVVAIRR